MKLTLKETADWQTFPADTVLLAKIESVTVRTAQRKDGTEFEKLSWKFKILDVLVVGDGSDPSEYSGMLAENIYGDTSVHFTTDERNVTRKWIEAALNMHVEVGFEIDLDMLAGRTVRAGTGTYPRRDGGQGHKIAYLMPSAGAQAPSSPWGEPTDKPPF